MKIIDFEEAKYNRDMKKEIIENEEEFINDSVMALFSAKYMGNREIIMNEITKQIKNAYTDKYDVDLLLLKINTKYNAFEKVYNLEMGKRIKKGKDNKNNQMKG